MKVFIQTYEGEGKDQIVTEKEEASVAAAKANKKIGEKIHYCYHDEKDIKACRLE